LRKNIIKIMIISVTVFVCFMASYSTSFAESSGQYKVVPLGTLGGSYSVAEDINDRGEIVGYDFSNITTRGTYSKAFIWKNGKMKELGTLPGCSWSRAHAINEKSEVAGGSKEA
jgi:probable HAF family extracellular repeat protein